MALGPSYGTPMVDGIAKIISAVELVEVAFDWMSGEEGGEEETGTRKPRVTLGF